MSNIPKIAAVVPMLKMKIGVVTKLGSALHQIMVVWQQLTMVRPNTHEIQTLRTWEIYRKFGRNREQLYALRLFVYYPVRFPTFLYKYL